ncbi:MAG TPA: hypothetical protein VN326_14555 [Casimicrobiaceae bacterium]|nr:hypothetical protein [Casimicrobiaceae bacterium]
MPAFKFPAFLSYSSADNQTWGGWLNDFHKVFSEGLAGELKIQGAQQAVPFFDIESLRGKAGSVESLLRDNVESSFALFVFLGRGYLKSEWCCKELEFFSNLHNGARDTLLQRVWIFEVDRLDGDLKSQYQKRLSQAGAEGLVSQRRQNFLDPNTNRRPVLILENLGTNQREYQDKIEPIVKELARRIEFASPLPPLARSSQDQRDVLIGLPTPDLIDSCTRLEVLLKAANKTVDRITLDDLYGLSASELDAKVANFRLIVIPVSEAKVLMPRLEGGHLAPQLDALPTSDLSRAIVWRPSDGKILDDAEKESDPRQLAVCNDLLRRAGSAAPAEEIVDKVTQRVVRAIAPGAEVVILVEDRGDGDSTGDQVVRELSQNWAKLSPETLRNVEFSSRSLDLVTLSKSPRPVSGDAVVVFPDPDEDMMQSKCSLIARNMQNWRTARIVVSPGLIVETDDQGAEFVVRYWPKARFSQTPCGEPPKPRGFADDSKGSLKRFFDSIAELKAAAARPSP